MAARDNRVTVARMQQELIEAQTTIATLQADLADVLQECGGMQVERDDARRRLDELKVQRVPGDRVIAPATGPRTPSGELLRERARADALAERVQVLQEANMRADCMHKLPAWGRFRVGDGLSCLILCCALRRDVACCSVYASVRHKAQHETQGAQQP